MRLTRLYPFVLAAFAMAALLPGPATAAATVTQVAAGLDNPRGIGFVDGRMVVAEAGHGGPACYTVPNGPPFPFCVGNTSQVSWVNATTGAHEPLVKGLFSISLGPEGVLGASGLSVSNGKIRVVLGFTPQEAPPTITIAQEQAGHLLSINPSTGKWRSLASVGENDFNYTLQFPLPTPGEVSPGTQEHDANPYGVLAMSNGTYVADAGANTLDWVGNDGKITILHHFDWRDPNPNNFPNDAVPTCVARAGGALWIGDLSGHLYRIAGDEVTQVVPKDDSGALLTHVTGCTTDSKGNLYLVNMFGPGIPFTSPSFFVGNVVKYQTHGGGASVLAGNLNFPNMAAIGPDGNLYVTAGSLCDAAGTSPAPPGAPNPCVGGGTVLRISLPHDDNGNHQG
jgi:hypothetical protein